MTLLLVNPNRESKPVPAMPLGLLRVAEAAERVGVPVQFLDLAFVSRPEQLLRKTIAKHQPAAVGFTVRNIDNADFRAPRFYLDEVRPLVAIARECCPGPIVIGGAGASMAPELVRADLGADCVVVGPGEGVVTQIYEAATGGEPLPPVLVGPPGAATLPAADYARWLQLGPWRRRAAPLPVQSRRGCPRKCVYCNYAAIDGSAKYLLGDVGEVVESIRQGVAATKIPHVEFVDSTFNSPPSYTIALCEALADADLGLNLGASGITPRFASREVLESMREAGFSAIWCSPDTAAPETIDAYGKGFSTEDLYGMARAADDLGFTVMWSFLFGGPGETEATVAETLRFAREEIPADHPVMLTSRMRIYPGTELARIYEAEGNPAPVLDPREPGQFYLSSHLDESRLDAVLFDAHESQPNLMYLDAAQAPVVGFLQWVNGLLGRRQPTWADYAPIRRRVMKMLGRA